MDTKVDWAGEGWLNDTNGEQQQRQCPWPEENWTKKKVKKHSSNFSAHLLVHGVSGVSDFARRYPERHTHTEAPLVVV